MTAKRGGLGKGLDSLIKENKTAKHTAPVKKEVVNAGPIMMKINDVEPNRDQPRKHFEEDALLELADSIKQFGILQPLIVQKRNDYYEIIAGERRWRAAKQAGIKEVPVIIKEYTDQEISLKQDEVAERVSKSRTAVTNSMRLLKLDERVQQMIIDDMISTGHARALLAIEDKEQQYILANKVFDEKLSVRDTEKLVKELKKPKKEKEKPVIQNAFVYEDLEERIKSIIGSKVHVNNKANGKGKIEIEYYSDNDLERIFELLMSIQEGK